MTERIKMSYFNINVYADVDVDEDTSVDIMIIEIWN